jgi:hypothetical protein
LAELFRTDLYRSFRTVMTFSFSFHRCAAQARPHRSLRWRYLFLLALGVPSLVVAQRPATTLATTPPTVVDTFTLGNGKIVQIPRGKIAHVADRVQRVPIELLSGLVFATVTVDGQQGLFIVDTGNPILILNTAHVTPGPVIDSAFVSDATGRNVPVLVHLVKRFQWAGGAIDSVGAVGMDLSGVEGQLKQIVGGRPILGMVGLAQFAHFLSVFDYQGKEIALYPLSATTGKSAVTIPTPTTTVPLTVTPSGAFITGVVDSTSFFKLDSGDDRMGIDADLAASLGARVTHTGKTTPIMGVGGVVSHTEVVTVDRIMVGTLAYDSVTMRALPIPRNAMDAGGGRRGTIGAPFFSRNRVGLDLAHKVMYIWKNAAEK